MLAFDGRLTCLAIFVHLFFEINGTWQVPHKQENINLVAVIFLFAYTLQPFQDQLEN